MLATKQRWSRLETASSRVFMPVMNDSFSTIRSKETDLKNKTKRLLATALNQVVSLLQCFGSGSGIRARIDLKCWIRIWNRDLHLNCWICIETNTDSKHWSLEQNTGSKSEFWFPFYQLFKMTKSNLTSTALKPHLTQKRKLLNV